MGREMILNTFFFLLKEGGLSVRQLMHVIELEKNVKHVYLRFIEKDIHNLFRKLGKKLKEMMVCIVSNTVRMQNELRLRHIFWSPSSCFDWYKKYGDVVFDTTYKFQEEFERSVQYSIHNETQCNVFMLRYYKDVNCREQMVFWVVNFIFFESKNIIKRHSRILCHHIFNIILHKDCHEVQSNYMPLQWRLQASHDNDEVDPQQVNVVFEEQVNVVHCPPQSKTKGRPKQRHFKGEKELSHNINTCGSCKGLRHNIVTCPLKENTQFSVNKKKKKKKN
ncbi:hypothetical protein MTR_2g035140 [Medicago truncatula]|uniref:FAR1-related sequence 11-like HTH-like domain-containing protein n=1 Tax=Medicago truncatula TaxID=3880 RepID=G7IMY9_MEDTR|nr:hypothetical protein MTR_2g035140 [Medicago truncatula]